MDFDLEWDSDIPLLPNGDLRLVSGWNYIRQAIIRFFLTNSNLVEGGVVISKADYQFDTSYGLSANSLISRVTTPQGIAEITQKMNQAIFQNPGIINNYAQDAQISVKDLGNGDIAVNAIIDYGNNITQSLTITMAGV